MEKTPGKEFYDTQIAALTRGDLDALAAQYSDDAVLVSFDFTVRGRDAIRAHMQGYLQMLGSFALLSTDKWAETDDSIFFEATVRTNLGQARVYDVFMLRGGKATHHFTGLISLSPEVGSR